MFTHLISLVLFFDAPRAANPFLATIAIITQGARKFTSNVLVVNHGTEERV